MAHRVEVQRLQEEITATGKTNSEFAHDALIGTRTLQAIFATGEASMRSLQAIALALSPDPKNFSTEEYKRFLKGASQTHGLESLSHAQLWDGLGSLEDKLRETAKRHPSDAGQPLILSHDVSIDIDPNGDAHIRNRFHIANIGSKSLKGLWRLAYFERPQDPEKFRISGRSGTRPLVITTDTNTDTFKTFFVKFPQELASRDTCRIAFEYKVFGKYYTKPGMIWDGQVLNLTNEFTIQVTIKTTRMVQFTLRRTDLSGGISTNTLAPAYPQNRKCSIKIPFKYPEVGTKCGLTWRIT